MVLGYYKYLVKKFIIDSFYKFNLRKDNYIGKNCSISKDLVINGSVNIRDNTVILGKVILNNNVSVGNGARIGNIEIGLNSHIESGVICTGYGNGKIIIGKESYIGINNILDWSDNITIGDFVHIAGPSTGLWTHSSARQCLNSLPLNNKDIEFRPTSPIVIEHNTYIGGNCTIYPGIIIHHHSIVAPNSVVTKNVKPHVMVGGVPAKIIKNI